MELPEDLWRGWAVRGKHLVTPHRQRVTADVLAHLIHMHETRKHFESVGLKAQAAAAREKRLQRARQLVCVVVVDLGAWKARHRPGAA